MSMTSLSSGRLRASNPARTAGLRLVMWGHSYIDAESAGTSDAVQNVLRTIGTIGWANRLLGHPMTFVGDVGRGSWLIDDMVALWASDVVPLHPQIVISSLGHNDLKNLYAGNAGQAPNDPAKAQLPAMMAKYRAWLRAVAGQGALIVLLAETPAGVNAAGANINWPAQIGVRFVQWNKFLQGLAIEFSNVLYVPLDRVTMDPTSSTFLNRAGHYYDQTHPGTLGSYYRGKMLAEHLRRVLPIHADPLEFQHAHSFNKTKLTTVTNKPVFDGTSATFYLGAGANLKFSAFRAIEVGDWVSVRFPGATDKFLCGRYLVTAATNDGFTVAAPGRTPGTAANHADVSNCTQHFINPIFVTTTGGQSNATGVVGTLTGTMPLGATLNNLPAGWSVAVDTATAHTLSDGSPGYGNWLTLTVSAPATPGTFDLRFVVGYNNTAFGASYDAERIGGVNHALQSGAEVLVVNSQANLGTVEVQTYVATQDGAGANLAFYKASDNYRDSSLEPQNSTYASPAGETMRLTCVTPELIINEDVATRCAQQIGLYVRIYSLGAMTDQVIRIGRVTCNVVDEPVERPGISWN